MSSRHTISRQRAIWSFDARGFGRELRQRREALGCSTREVADRAGVSQSYVVALEGSRSSRDASGPCPTVDVLTRLASALGVEPWVLLRPSLRRPGPHVLWVVEDDGASMFDVAKSFVKDVDVWVSAGSRGDTAEPVNHIRLHSDDATSYDRDQVAAAIDGGLAAMAPQIDGQRLGLVFSEHDSVLLGATDAVLDVEHEWSALVGQAAWSAGAQPAWTLCVYELEVLRQMTDPLDACLDLMRSHDTIWTSKGRTLHRNRAASMRVLQRMRPPRTRADDWRRVCTRQLDRVSGH